LFYDKLDVKYIGYLILIISVKNIAILILFLHITIGTLFAQVLDRPELLYPENGETGIPTTVEVRWQQVQGAQTYTLQVATHWNFPVGQIILNQSGITETSYIVQNLNSGTTYHWRVRAVNNAGNSQWSETYAFTTNGEIPASPVLVSPVQNASGIPINPVLLWKSLPEARSYTVQVSKDEDMSSPVINVTGITDTTHALDNLEYNTRYFWRVNASNESGTGEWSEVWNFNTIRLPNVTTTNTTGIRDVAATLNGTVIDIGEPELTDHGFVYSTSSNPDHTDQVVSLGIRNTTGSFAYDLTGLAPGTVYYVRTYAVNSGGTVYGEVLSFTTTYPVQLLFTQQPADTPAGQHLPTIGVEARDANNNLTTTFSGEVTVTLHDNPGNAVLSGETKRSATDGSVIFEDLIIHTVGTGYTLRVSAANMSDAISNSFSILPNESTILIKFSGDGQSGMVNTPLAELFIVRVTDGSGNSKSGVTVMFRITVTPEGATGHTLSNESSVTDSEGKAGTLLTLGDLNGVYRVTAWADGSNDVTFNASIETIRISGVITDAGIGLEDVDVIVSWNDYVQSTKTTTTGGYNLFGIPVGVTHVNIIPGKSGFRFEPEDTVIQGPVINNILNINFRATPPRKPELSGPPNGAVDIPTELTLTWSEVAYTTHYELQLSTSYEFDTNIIISREDLQETDFLIDNLHHGQTYYWRIRAVNMVGPGEWSDIWNFSVRPTTVHQLSLRSGWNLVSSYIEPLDSSLESLFEPVLDNLILVKDGDGRTFVPLFGIDDIKNWSYSSGYQIYLDPQAGTLTLYGVKVKPETVQIPLKGTWNMVGYLRSEPMNAIAALRSIESKLIIAKNGAGEVYIPPGVIGEDLINTMGDMRPGEGYQLFLSAVADLVYPENTVGESPVADTGTASDREPGYIRRDPTHYIVGAQTGSNATLIVRSEELRAGDEVAVRSESGLLVGGAAVHSDGQAVVSVWGDNIYDKESVNGALDREKLSLTVWSAQEGREHDLELLSVTDIATGTDGTELLFTRDAIWLGTVNVVREIPDEFVLHQNYPNPFNPSTVIGYRLNDNGHVTLKVYDILGREVITLVDEEQSPGIYEVEFNAEANYQFAPASGVYLYQLKAGNYTATKKMIILK
jgi:hypothetical protein